MTSKRALWKAFIPLALITATVQQADGRPNSTNTITPSIRLSSKGDVERHSLQYAQLPYENASSLKSDVIHPFSKSLDTADRPALSFHKMPHTKSSGHRHSKRRNLNRRNPQPEMGSASSTRYSVLQPFPLPTPSHTNNQAYHRNGRRQDTREHTPHPFRQIYASNPVSRNEEQPPFTYINLQTVQNQNLPDSQLKSGYGHVYDQPQNQHIQALQRSVVMGDAPGSEARPNYRKKPLLTETEQHLQQGTVDDTATPLKYHTASSPSSANLSNLDYNVQRHRIAENQRQIHDVQSRIRATTENQQDDELNQHNRYLKIIISPEDLKNIEKYSYHPHQKLYQTKPEEPNVTEKQAQAFQQPKIDSNSLPASQTQQRMTSPSYFSVMEMQNQKLISIHEPHKMMMQQPNEMMTIQKPEKMMMQQPDEMMTIQKPEKMMMQQPDEMRTIQKPEKMMMQQLNEMMTVQKPEKMMMQQPSEMRKQEMEELQQVAKATQIPKAVDILREMDLLRAKTTKILRQEAEAMEKQKEMERRRQQIADEISETVYQQMLDLLGHLTGETATRTEVKAPQQNPSEVIYQPLVVMQRQEDAEMRRQPAADTQKEAEMETQKQKLMVMLLQQMTEMQKQNAVNLQVKRPIQIRNAMELLHQQAMGMKIKSATDRQVPREMEGLKQDLMQMLTQKLIEMQQQQAKGSETEPRINLQKQMSLEQEERNKKQQSTQSHKPSEGMEMQLIQAMEVLLRNIIEMRELQLNEPQERMGVKVQSQSMMGMSLRKTAYTNTQHTKAQPQSTIRSQKPTQVEMPLRKAAEELRQQIYGTMQRPETTEMPIWQTVGEVNQQMPKIQNQHLLKIQDDDMSSPNAAIQTVYDKVDAMNSAKEQPENTEGDQRGSAPESKGETVGYRQVLIHIPHMLTKHPRIFTRQNNQMHTDHATSYISDTDKNSNVDLNTRGKHFSYSSISDHEASVQQDLESSNNGLVNPIIRLIPVIKFPVESKSDNNYDFSQSPIFSDSPAIYESPSLHDASPFFPESASYPRTVFRSNLYSYDDMRLYGRDSSRIQDLPQLYKD